MRKYKIPFLLFLLTPVFYSLRLGSLSLWGDEVSTLNFTSTLERIAADRFHPPLYYALLFLFRQASGEGETLLRLFSVLFAAAGVSISYLFAMRISGGNKKLSLIASLLVMTSPYLLLYSRMIRYFSMLFFAGVLVNHLFLKILDEREGLKNYLYYSLASVFLIYTDYLGGIILLIHFIHILIIFRKTGDFDFRKILLSWLSVMILSLPVLIRLASSVLEQKGNLFVHETQGTLKAFFFKIAYQYSSLLTGETMTVSAVAAMPLVLIALAVLLKKNMLSPSAGKQRLFPAIFLLSVPLLNSLITPFFVLKLPVTHVTKLSLYLIPLFYSFILPRDFSGAPAKFAISILFAANIYGSLNCFLGREFHNPNFAAPWREIAETVSIEADEETPIIVRDNNSAFLHYYKGGGRILNMAKIEELKRPDIGKKAILVTRNTGSENLMEIEKISKYLNERGKIEKAYYFLPLNSLERKLKESFLNVPLPGNYIDVLIFRF
ncbi:MAG: glycosyltransferase family 39 protein [Deltaproteobacteria bacterium]|nr:glycosyltransferase family 39 protein [Deltaproteobacteria bacterium]